MSQKLPHISLQDIQKYLPDFTEDKLLNLKRIMLELNVTFEELMTQFYYAGGNDYNDHKIGGDPHLDYFIKNFPMYLMPKCEHKCLCGAWIKKNRFITKDRLIFHVIGSCCITHFIPEERRGRTCNICFKPHRNRKDNNCKECRIKIKIENKIKAENDKKIKEQEEEDKWRKNFNVRIKEVCNEDNERINMEKEDVRLMKIKKEEEEKRMKERAERERIQREYNYKNNIGFCSDCKKPIETKYKKCYGCNNNSGFCIDCKKAIDKKYKKCYKCNKND
jgi:hypothetical protein